MKETTQNYIEEIIEKFKLQCFCTDEAIKHTGFACSYDKDEASKFLTTALQGLVEEIVDIVSDEATGANCLTKKWKCCGYHDACENIIKRVDELSSKNDYEEWVTLTNETKQ